MNKINAIKDWHVIETNHDGFTLKFDTVGDADKIRHYVNELIKTLNGILEIEARKP